jgi:hypothetical protein
MSRGNSDNLKRAAQAKREAARTRAEKGLLRLLKSGGPITFQTVAQEAGVSKDFLYRTTDLRERIMDLRDRASASHTGPAPAAATDGQAPTVTSSIVRTLTVKLAEERSASRRKIAELEAALAAAQGQLLQLRRQESTGVDRPGHP